MKNIILILVLAFLSQIMASDIIQYDPNSAVITNQVILYLKSEDTFKWQNVSNVLINSIVPTNNTVPWKVVGTNIIVLTSNEINQINTNRDTIRLNETKTNLINLYLRDQETQEHANKAAIDTIIELLVVQLNQLRTNPVNILPVITEAQAKTIFFQSYSNKINLINQ
jgi:hypothetical protein